MPGHGGMVGPGVLNSMLGSNFPLMLKSRLACLGLLSHLIVPLRSICCGHSKEFTILLCVISFY